MKLKTYGYFAICLCVITVFAAMAYACRHSIFKIIIVGIFLLFAGAGIIIAYKTDEPDKPFIIGSRESLFKMAAVFIGAVLTYLLVKYVDMNSLMISPLIGLLGALVFPRYGDAIFCGSFVGMTGIQVLGLYYFITAALTSAFVFLAATNTFKGLGGKLGTIAFISCLFMAFINRSAQIRPPSSYWDNYALYISIGAISAYVTFVLNNRANVGPVMASAIIGFFGAVVFLYVNGGAYAGYAPVIYGASFIGMSSKKTLPSFVMVLSAGMIFGVIYVFNINNFTGIGGRLGLTAFLSVLITTGLFCAFENIIKRNKARRYE